MNPRHVLLIVTATAALAGAPAPAQVLTQTLTQQSQQPLAQQPLTQQSATQQPLTQQPLGQQPLTQQPLTQQPLAQQPATQQSPAQQPLTQQPVTLQQVTSQQPAPQQAVPQQAVPQQPAPQPATPPQAEKRVSAPSAQQPAEKRANGTTQAALPEFKVAPTLEKRSGLLSMAFRDAPIHEVFEMLARGERVNIVLRKGVTGNVSVNLYDVSLAQAVQSVAEAGGYAVEQPRPGEFVVLERTQAGEDAARAGMVVKSYKVQYSNPRFVAEILAKHLSRMGKITPLPDRNMLVIEDQAAYHTRIAAILREIDSEPKQILIEAKILEITLDEGESFGIDWNKIINTTTGSAFGIQGLATRGAPGFFFNLVNDKVTAYLSALNSRGRVHTLSTPKLLALEHQEATVMIGDRTGYKVTTTINLVTNETVQFLDTGVILRVIPSVDERGRIMMKIHPEVSSGSISAGIPSKKSTEVTTQLMAEDGQAILIGGLIKRDASLRRTGMPILGALPVVGYLFANKEENNKSSETIVLITPHVIRNPLESISGSDRDAMDQAERALTKQGTGLGNNLPMRVDPPAPAPAQAPAPAPAPASTPAPAAASEPAPSPAPQPAPQAASQSQ